MNCDTIQHELEGLLGSEHPDRPSADIQAHLDACPACRDWQHRLVQIEANISRLHVPGSATRDAFLLDLVLPDNPAEGTTEATPAPKPRPAAASVSSSGPLIRLSLPSAKRTPTPPLRVLAYQYRYPLAGAAAAAVLLIGLIGMMANRGDRQPNGNSTPVAHVRPTPDPLVANLVHENLNLVAADKIEKRSEALTKIADDLNRESQALGQAENGAELATLLTELRTKVNEALKQLQPQRPDVPAVIVADATPANADRVKQLSRNRGLIQTLVDGGIRIAKERDSLQRVDSCSEVARGIAGEIRQAAAAHDGDRAFEMGQHLRDLLQSGIASNIRSVHNEARKHARDVSLAQKEKMEHVRDWVKDVTGGVEDQLRIATDSDMKQTLDSIRVARRDVESAVRG
jgi:hypothetical protein